MNSIQKQGITAKLIAVCGMSFVVILLLLPVHAFFSTWLGTVIGPLLVWKSWKEIVLALLVPFVAIYCILRPDIAKTIWSRSINKLIAIYTALFLVLAIFSTASNQAVIASLLMNLRFLAMFVLAQLIVAADYPYVKRLKALMLAWLMWVMIGLSVLAIIQVTILPKDFLNLFGYNKDTTIAPLSLVDSDPNALRAFATMRGPNTLGAYLLIPLAFAIYFVLRRERLWLAGGALLLGLIALVLTDSRSAWIGLIVTIVTLALLLLPRDKLILWVKRVTLPAIAGLLIMLLGALTIPSVRLAVFHSASYRASLVQGSTQDHWAATLHGIHDIVVDPLGTGPGSAGPASFYNKNAQPIISEDYFVQIGQETGMLGMALFLIICFMVGKLLFIARSTAASLLLASFIGLCVVNVFLHGWADDPTAMTWWGLAGLFIGASDTSKGVGGLVRAWFHRPKTIA